MYFDTEGNEVKIPSPTSPPEELKRYYRVCVRRKDPTISIEEFDEVYDYYYGRRYNVFALLDSYVKETGALKDEEGKNPFRKRAYSKALLVLKKTNVPFLSKKQLTSYPGVGPSIADKILKSVFGEETPTYITNEAERALVYSDLKGIWGAASVVKKWLDMKIFTIEDLRKAVKEGKVSLTTMQTIGLNHFEDLKKRIPRKEVKEIGDFIYEVISEIIPDLLLLGPEDQRLFGNEGEGKLLIGGSYSRNKPDSGDVDVILIVPKKTYTHLGTHQGYIRPDIHKGYIKKIVEAFRTMEGVEIGAAGEKQMMMVLSLGPSHPYRRVDIFFRTPLEAPATVLQYTSSGPYNVRIRGEANEKGYMLNSSGLFELSIDPNKKSKKAGKRVKVRDVKEIFKVLGLKYLPADQRD